VAVDIHREAELPAEQHRASGDVVQQQGGAVAAVVGLALLGDPGPVGSATLQRRPPEHVPAAGQQLDVLDDDVGVAGQVATDPVQAGAAAMIGDVDSRDVHEHILLVP
jgi:hypothetical protein